MRASQTYEKDNLNPKDIASNKDEHAFIQTQKNKLLSKEARE